MKVIIAIDGSDCSLAALDSVVDRQWASSAEFRVLSIVEPPTAEEDAESHTSYTPYLGEAEHLLFQQARELVLERVEYLKRELPHNNVVGEVIEGNIVDSIVHAASQWGADRIIMGSHGRTGVHRYLIGSVAEAVVSKAPCSVEIIRKPAPKSEEHENKAEAAVS